MAGERRDNIMSLEQAIQREEAYRRKVSKLQLNLNNDLMPLALEVRIQTDGWIIFLFLNQCSFFFFFFCFFFNETTIVFSLRHPKVKTDCFSGFHCEYLFSLLIKKNIFFPY
jgi:hypothetical protein